MQTKTSYQNDELILMLRDDKIHFQKFQDAFYQPMGKYYCKKFYGKFPKAEKIMLNFSRLMPGVFESRNWDRALLSFAEICKENHIAWFLTGSACDAVRGIHVFPHDLDIQIAFRHWHRAEEIFEDYIVEPFIETKDWVRAYWGRLVVENMLVDLVADKTYDFPNHDYEPFLWKGNLLWLETFRARYEMELARDRKERIAAIENFISENIV